jgi:hypothetical protein
MMTRKQKEKAIKDWERDKKLARDAYRQLRAADVFDDRDGWNSPPAVIPKAGEISGNEEAGLAGTPFDPFANTR